MPASSRLFARAALTALSFLFPVAAHAACPDSPTPTATLSACAIRVTWPSIPDALGYDLWRFPAAGGPGTRIAINLPSSTLAFNDTSYTAGATGYVYRVASRGFILACPTGVGPVGAPSNTVVSPAFTNLPTQSLDVSACQVTVSVTTDSAATGVNIFRSTSPDPATATQIGAAAPTGPNLWTFTESLPPPGTTYYYSSQAVDPCRASARTAPTAPPAPARPVPPTIAAQPASCGVALTITTTPGVTAVNIWRAYANPDPAAGAQIGTATGGPTQWTFLDDQATPGSPATYSAVALTDCSASDFAPPVSITASSTAWPTPVPASTPLVNDCTPTMSWTAAQGTTRVDVSSVGAGGTLLSVGPATRVGTSNTWSISLASPPPSVTSYVAVAAGPPACLASDRSAAITFGPSTDPPASVTGLTATTTLCDRIELSWPAIRGARSYDINADAGFTFVSLPAPNGSTVTFTDTVPLTGSPLPATRTYVIFSRNSCGRSLVPTVIVGARGSDAGPALASPLQSQIVGSGKLATITASLPSGVSFQGLQWLRDGRPLTPGARFSGINSPTLTINPVLLQDVGRYAIRVAGCSSSTDSAPMVLAVQQPCRADFDESGQRTIDDIFIFLTAWFAGCP